MKITFVNSTRKWGGVKTWTLDFGRALRQRGHRVLVVARAGTPFVEACQEANFEVRPFTFGPKYNPVAIVRMRSLLRGERPDVVVVNISRDLEVGALAAKLCGLPVVHRVGLVEDYRGTLEEKLRHRLLVDRILVPGEWMRDGLLKRFSWFRPEEIEAIPNSKQLGVPRGEPPSEHGPIVFGITSQLSPSKGHGLLLEAWERTVAGGLPVRLDIAGVGALEEQLREEVTRRGLSESVRFCGFQRDVGSFLSGLHAFVLPSLKEGFPNTLLEALCAGLPTVAYDLPGCREMLGDAGVLVPVGSVEGLAAALGQVAGSAELRGALATKARHRAEERYDLQKNVLRLESLFREVARR